MRPQVDYRVSRLPLLAAALLLWGASTPPVQARGPAATAGSIRARLEAPGVARLAGARVTVHANVHAFYEARRWEPAFAESHVQRALLARIHDAADDGLNPAAVGAERAVRIARSLDAARRADRPELVAVRLADLDIALTDAYLRYGDALLGRNVDAAALYGAQWQPARRPGDPAAALHRALSGPRPAYAVVATLERFAPAHPEYSALRARLGTLRHLLETGWKPLRRPDSVAIGTRSVWVPAFRERLVALGFASPGAEDPYGIDSTLIQGVREFQAARGLEATGDPDSVTVATLNARPTGLIASLALNLARWRWLPDDLGERHVLVNMPAYSIEVRERVGGVTQTVLEMPAVIGMARAGTWTTPVMSDRIHQVVFQPPWYVPPSIASAVVYPAARADSGTTLTSRGYETYFNGAPVDPATLDWDEVTPGQLRFVQRPGPGNAMGRVKFVMPNPYFILIHDTNKPWSFRSEQRAFSHGCVHAGDPLSLAQYVLGSCGALSADETEAAYRGWASRTVEVTDPLPVHLTYFTAWPDADGSIRYFDDVYGHDATLSDALGFAPVDAEKSDSDTKEQAPASRRGRG